MKLKDKVAVITGGSSGIGLGIAQEFQAEGASTVILGRHPQTLEVARQHLGPDTLIVPGDVSKMEDLDTLYERTAARFGKIDVLVVNAGIVKLAPIDQVDEAMFDNIVNINFKGAFFTIQKALPHLQEGASIILISSNGQGRGFPTTSVYAATKAAVRSLARTLSMDLLDRGIRVNAISPGAIDTPIFEKFLPKEYLIQAKQDLQKMVPLQRFGTPKEVATVAVFLASSDSSFVLGEEITVDGGWSQLDPITTSMKGPMS
jgi:NAD(P)-dependent dehydrogenase (short-subunit alcohol dehydrogenase family)